jgi:sensor domain CHASE-containing protein
MPHLEETVVLSNARQPDRDNETCNDTHVFKLAAVVDLMQGGRGMMMIS